MKKSIFTLGLIASSFLFANATEKLPTDLDMSNNTDPKVENLIKAKVQVFQYTVKTTSGVFTGTAYTKAQMAEEIENITNNVNIVSTSVEKISLDTKVYGESVYAWGASSNAGYASGVANTLEEAQRMVKLVGNDDVSKTRIIETIKVVK